MNMMREKAEFARVNSPSPTIFHDETCNHCHHCRIIRADSRIFAIIEKAMRPNILPNLMLTLYIRTFHTLH